MNRQKIWLSGVLLMVSGISLAAVVEQGLTVRGRAEEWVVPTCAYVTVYDEERSNQADIAFRMVEKLTGRIISGVKKKCDGVTDVLVRTEQIKVQTEIGKLTSADASDYYVRQRLRFVCAPEDAVTADIIYTACELSAIVYGTSSATSVAIYPYNDTDTGRPVFFGAEANAELTRRMYEKALASAAERATLHAELSGKKVGKILSIQCDEFINGEVSAQWALKDGFPTPILGRSSDKIYVSYDVVVTYEIAE